MSEQNRVKTLLEVLPDGVVLADKKARIVFVSERAGEMFGYKPDELIGQPVEVLIPDQHLAKTIEDQARIKSKPQKRMISEALNFSGNVKGGDNFPVEITLSPIEVDGKQLTLVLVHDITVRKRNEQALRSIVEGTVSVVGHTFFKLLVQHLANALHVQYALVAVRCGNSTSRVKTLAIWTGEGLSENFEYDLKGTPCESVERGGVCFYPEGVQTQFPSDEMLRDMLVESYVGAPLVTAPKQVIGHLAVLGRQPMRDEQWSKDILKIFASRVTVEVERLQVQEMLQCEKDDLAKLNSLMMNREQRILELKQEVNVLQERLGQTGKYTV